jgi:hypothetical protein
MEAWRATHRPGETMESYEAACACGAPDSGLAFAQVAVFECAAAATEAGAAMRLDPGQPGLEEAYYLIVDELSCLATIFAADDLYLAEYAAACDGIDSMRAASGGAKYVWAMLRGVSSGQR